MKNILILGASGSLPKVVIPVLLQNPEIKLTLFARHTHELMPLADNRVTIVQGDATSLTQLEKILPGQDIVYANLAGQLETMAKNIVQAMHQQQLKRLIWISSMGIYSETATETDSILAPYRQSAKIIEDSDLNYTIIRPAWFTHDTEINYQLTHKGEAFQGQQVSRHSIANLINKLIQNPEYAVRESLGIAKV